MPSLAPETQLEDGVRRRATKGEHFVPIPQPTQADVNSGPLDGKENAEAIEDLKQRAKRAIQEYRAEHGLGHYNEDRFEQVFKPIDKYPSGYSKLAAYECCDDNFLMFKEFRWLSTRVLLHLQDELQVLLGDLAALDEYDRGKDPMRLASRRRDESIDDRRKDMLSNIEEKLDRYYKLLLRTNGLSRLDRPSYRNQRSVFNAIHATGSQVQAESEWIGDREDLVALAPGQERSVLNVAVEESINWARRLGPRGMSIAVSLFQTPEQGRRAGKENLYLYSQDRLDTVANAITTLIATLMLLVPIGILSMTNAGGFGQLIIVLIFTQLFSLSIAVLTKARKHELFGVTAAYVAVLVVFLANNSPPTTVTTLS